jgi:hypothetical protein
MSGLGDITPSDIKEIIEAKLEAITFLRAVQKLDEHSVESLLKLAGESPQSTQKLFSGIVMIVFELAEGLAQRSGTDAETVLKAVHGASLGLKLLQDGALE